MAKLVVAADGARSAIRQQCNMPITYWITTTMLWWPQ